MRFRFVSKPILLMLGCLLLDCAQVLGETAIAQDTNATIPASISIDSTNTPARLIEPIKFAGFTVTNIANSTVATNLMNVKIGSLGAYGETNAEGKVIEHDGYDFMADANMARIRIETVNQFAAVDPAANPISGDDYRAYHHMREVRDMLQFMGDAQSSKQSFLKGDYLLDLPVTVLQTGHFDLGKTMAEKRDEALHSASVKGATLRDYMKPASAIPISHVQLAGTMLKFRDEQLKTDFTIKELARGDVDSDGIEDVLLRVEENPGSSWNCVVGKTAVNTHLCFILPLGE